MDEFINEITKPLFIYRMASGRLEGLRDVSANDSYQKRSAQTRKSKAAREIEAAILKYSARLQAG